MTEMVEGVGRMTAHYQEEGIQQRGRGKRAHEYWRGNVNAFGNLAHWVVNLDINLGARKS